MEWKTKITDLLGCRYPILQGATDMLGVWQFAAAVAEAGAHGTITASISKTPEQLREDIKRCREATTGTFGVNLSIGICPQIDGMLEVCIEERMPVETALYKPDALAKRIKESGLPWIHKSARVRDAVHAQELGVDALILIGLEGAGFKNPAQYPTMTTILDGVRRLSVPVIAAGGIGDAHGFLGALAMGAEGVMMASAFLTTKESAISRACKDAMINLKLDDPEFRNRVMTPRIFDPKARRQATEEINWADAVSFSVVGIEEVLSVKELLEKIVSEAEAIVNGWRFLK
ncbi:MAG: nitronate monooxygenase [Syntrophales bacterium]|nr:nitronate monooxygenase [Syntrophales bacterium]